MDNIREMPGYGEEENVKRIVLPLHVVKQARNGLFDMNITRRSLFPGLQGYAEALGVMHPVFTDDKEGRT